MWKKKERRVILCYGLLFDRNCLFFTFFSLLKFTSISCCPQNACALCYAIQPRVPASVFTFNPFMLPNRSLPVFPNWHAHLFSVLTLVGIVIWTISFSGVKTKNTFGVLFILKREGLLSMCFFFCRPEQGNKSESNHLGHGRIEVNAICPVISGWEVSER